MYSKFSGLAFMVVLSGAIAVAPQQAMSQGQVLQDNAPGSVLVFPRFDIRGDSSTQLRIVNNSHRDVNVKLNYVCPGVKNVNDFCASLDRTVDFTGYQTRVIDVADQNPPCDQGFVVAFPLSYRNRPKSFNYLTGSYHIFNGRRHEMETAVAVQSVRERDQECSGDDGFLRFNGSDYAYMGTSLYTDFLATSTSDEVTQGSRLTLLTMDTLAGMQNPAAVVFIDFWNSAEVPFSTSHEFVCWSEVQLDDIDLNFLEENLGTTYGSMSITPFPNCPIPGGCPPLVPFDPTILGAITEFGDGLQAGHTLHHDLEPKETAYQPR